MTWPVGDVLAQWCRENHSTQRSLAKRAQTSEKHLSQIIHGHAHLSAELAVRLGWVTGLAPQLLFRLQNDRLIEMALEAADAFEHFEVVVKRMLNTPPVKRAKK